MLEWFRVTEFHAGRGAVIVVILIAMALVEEAWFDWIQVGWIVVPLLCLGLITYLYERRWVMAGSYWLRYGRRWVRTYDLVRVESDVQGRMSLTDADGRCVRVYLSSLTARRELWDLVYNGILHSAQWQNPALQMNVSASAALCIPTRRHNVLR